MKATVRAYGHLSIELFCPDGSPAAMALLSRWLFCIWDLSVPRAPTPPRKAAVGDGPPSTNTACPSFCPRAHPQHSLAACTQHSLHGRQEQEEACRQRGDGTQKLKQRRQQAVAAPPTTLRCACCRPLRSSIVCEPLKVCALRLTHNSAYCGHQRFPPDGHRRVRCNRALQACRGLYSGLCASSGKLAGCLAGRGLLPLWHLK